MNDKADILICGGGIIGLTIAGELLKKDHKNIVIIDKEESLGLHASGRNSGVLHAGIYYSPDSLKAKLCLRGNLLMKEYCREKGIPVSETGKVIVAKNKDEIPALEELYQRALKNGAKAELINEEQLKDIEPYAKTCGTALFSPQTAVVDPEKVLQSIEEELVSSGRVKVLKGIRFKGVEKFSEIVTDQGSMEYDLFINTAGAYSDRVAHAFGTGLNYRIIPFKGTYRKLIKEKSFLVNGNIYPVPDIRNPFLGVHFTKIADGTVYIGPTAIPAFGRENYGVTQGMDTELFQILYRDVVMFISNPQFRGIAFTEPRKYTMKSFFEDIKDMVEPLSPEDIEPGNKTGIRPQLVDWEKKELVMDYIVEKADNSIHILNAVSPGFTSSMAFAKFVVDTYVAV